MLHTARTDRKGMTANLLTRRSAYARLVGRTYIVLCRAIAQSVPTMALQIILILAPWPADRVSPRFPSTNASFLSGG